MTPTNQESTQQVIRGAAKKYAKTLGLYHEKETASTIDDFTAGASFALQSPELLQGVMGEFTEWALLHYERIGRNKWAEKWTSYTTAELIQLFFKHKQKENDTNT